MLSNSELHIDSLQHADHFTDNSWCASCWTCWLGDGWRHWLSSHLSATWRIWYASGGLCVLPLCAMLKILSQWTVFRGLCFIQDFRAHRMHAMTPMLCEVRSLLPIACARHPDYTRVDRTFECCQPIDYWLIVTRRSIHGQLVAVVHVDHGWEVVVVPPLHPLTNLVRLRELVCNAKDVSHPFRSVCYMLDF